MAPKNRELQTQESISRDFYTQLDALFHPVLQKPTYCGILHITPGIALTFFLF